MFKFLPIVYQILYESDSESAQQAHQLGLVSGGWGTWKDASGKTVAKTIQGKLVKLEDVDDLDFEDDMNDFAQTIRDKYQNDLKSFELNFDTRTGDLQLSRVFLKKSSQGHGVGTAIMNDLLQYADAHHKRITLTPAEPSKEHGTTSTARLQRFYKQFGFVPNKGRYKDFRISDTMLREPKK